MLYAMSNFRPLVAVDPGRCREEMYGVFRKQVLPSLLYNIQNDKIFHSTHNHMHYKLIQ